MKIASSRIAVMTVASANYMPYVKTLMQSVQETNPNYRRYLFLVDKYNDNLEQGNNFEIVESESIEIDSFADMAIRYDVMELNTAVKPFAIEWLFNNTDAETVIYLDPDILVCRRLNELEEILAGGASIVVTPHLTKPLEDGRLPNDHHMLQAGVFNLGFIAVNRCDEAREFVRWWGRRLKTQGYSDIASNLFTDQRWVDLAPCFLENLVIFRSHAYNVAYWNLMQRPVSNRRGRMVFEDGPLAFFHFSGLDRRELAVVSKHQDRLKWEDIEPYQELFRSYRARLESNGWHAKVQPSYEYDGIKGLKLSSIIRRLYRELYPQTVSNSVIDDQFILSMCNAPAGLANDSEGRITRLMYWLYRNRPDLQVAYNLHSDEGLKGYRNWFEVSTPREYGLDERFTSPSHCIADLTSTSVNKMTLAHGIPNQDRSVAYRKWRKVRKWLIERI